MRLLSPSLQAFQAVAAHGTVHAAAKSLHITQTGVTQRIKAIENQLSTSLFVRSRSGMTLTQEGEVLLRYCYSFGTLEGEVLSYITTTGTESNVFISMTGPTTIMRSRVIPACVNVMKQYPHLHVQFDINDSENRVESLYRGENQLAMIEQHLLTKELAYKNLKPESYVFVVPYAWRHRSMQQIVEQERIIDFSRQEKMTFAYLEKYGLFEAANKDRHFTNQIDTLAYLISQELGYGVLPLEFAKSFVANKQLAILDEEKSYPHLLVLAWYPRHVQPNYFSDLIDACR